MAAQAILTITKDGETIKAYPLEGEVLLGRAEDCTIRLNDRAISRQHAVFRWVSGQLQVEKKSEFAPMLVNGAELSQAILKEGDLVSIGPYQVKWNLEKPTTPQAQVASISADIISPIDEEKNAAEVLGGGLVSESEGGDAAFQPENSLDNHLENNIDNNLGNNLGGSESAPAEADNQNFDFGQANGENQQIQLASPEEEVSEPIDEDGKTKLTPAAKVSIQLVFKPGTANHTEYELTQDEISIGRGKNCDIVLNDKKASRKNSIIRRAGLNFVIKDLDSANGTFVNGAKVQEQELTGDDTIMVGGVEFQFKVLSLDYAAKEKDFMALLPEPEEEPFSENSGVPGVGDAGGVLGIDGGGIGQPLGSSDLMIPGVGGPVQSGIPGGIGNISGIAGLGAATGKKTLLERFRALPPRTQILGLVVALGVAYFIVFEDLDPTTSTKTNQVKPRSSPSPVVSAGPLTFETLSPEQRRFVEAQHELAFNHYKNKDYDNALFEIQKIFQLIQDYKDSREIERYAKEGKRKTEAIEEERRKKEEEAKLKAKIAVLVEETQQLMEKKLYEQAKELFTQVLALDPDNPSVAGWRKAIEEYEDQIRIQEQQKQVQAEINKQAQHVFNEAMDLKKSKKYHSAIRVFQTVLDVGSSDAKLLARTKKMIADCRNTIRNLRDPVLAEAKNEESAGEFSKAYHLFEKATRIDPPHPAGHAGMNRIKGILHERAKALYTEGILAESYSDFSVAKKMYQECLAVAPKDDIYYERAQRKLAHFFKKDETGAQ